MNRAVILTSIFITTLLTMAVTSNTSWARNPGRNLGPGAAYLGPGASQLGGGSPNSNGSPSRITIPLDANPHFKPNGRPPLGHPTGPGHPHPWALGRRLHPIPLNGPIGVPPRIDPPIFGRPPVLPIHGLPQVPYVGGYSAIESRDDVAPLSNPEPAQLDWISGGHAAYGSEDNLTADTNSDVSTIVTSISSMSLNQAPAGSAGFDAELLANPLPSWSDQDQTDTRSLAFGGHNALLSANPVPQTPQGGYGQNDSPGYPGNPMSDPGAFTFSHLSDGNLPDLIVDQFEALGELSFAKDGELTLPVRLVVKNQGQRPADVFKISAHSRIRGAQRYDQIPLVVRDDARKYVQTDSHSPWTRSPLAPGESLELHGEMNLIYLMGSTVSLVIWADSTAGDEFASPHGRVPESDEQNNVSKPIFLNVPVVPDTGALADGPRETARYAAASHNQQEEREIAIEFDRLQSLARSQRDDPGSDEPYAVVFAANLRTGESHIRAFGWTHGPGGEDTMNAGVDPGETHPIQHMYDPATRSDTPNTITLSRVRGAEDVVILMLVAESDYGTGLFGPGVLPSHLKLASALQQSGRLRQIVDAAQSTGNRLPRDFILDALQKEMRQAYFQGNFSGDPGSDEDDELYRSGQYGRPRLAAEIYFVMPNGSFERRDDFEGCGAKYRLYTRFALAERSNPPSYGVPVLP